MGDIGFDTMAALAAISLLAGFVDSIAGGGGLLIVPALMLAGLDPAQAIATNKVQGSFAAASATWTFGRKGLIRWDRAWRYALVAFASGSRGRCASDFSPSVLEVLIPVLLIVIAIYFALSRKIQDADATARMTTLTFGLSAPVAIGFYDGIFGPGAGSFYMVAFVMLLGYGVVRATAHTKLLNFSSNLGSLLLYSATGAVVWPLGLVMAGASGWSARRSARTWPCASVETPATCTVIETSDGGGSAVTVVTVNGSQTVDLMENTTSNDPVVAEPIVNTYESAPGSLVVTKTIAGSAAGEQGEVVLHVSCDNGLEQDITIPAGATGDTSTTIDDLPAGTTCTVTETANGSSSTVTVTVDTEGSPATIPAGDDTVVLLTNTYESAPGSLVVTKTIAGSAAGEQGEVVLHVSCDNGLEQDITIPAGATGDTSTTIDDLPAGTTCTVTETANGSSSTVTVTVDTEGSPATIPAGDDTVVLLTNTYESAPGSLVVTKTITGSAAGEQGEVVLHVSCDNGLEQDITIPAGATGDTSTTIDDLPAGTTCTVTETTDGSTSYVYVTITGLGSVAVFAGGLAAIDVTDRYEAQTIPAVMPISPVQGNTGYPAQYTGYPTPPYTANAVLPTTGAPGAMGGLVWLSLALIGIGVALQLASRRGRRADQLNHPPIGTQAISPRGPADAPDAVNCLRTIRADPATNSVRFLLAAPNIPGGGEWNPDRRSLCMTAACRVGIRTEPTPPGRTRRCSAGRARPAVLTWPPCASTEA